MAERIKLRRKKSNLTKEQLAEKIGISYQAVSKWENGTSMPDTALFPKLSNILSVSLDYLFTGKDEKSFEKLVKWGNITGIVTRDIHGDVRKIIGDVQADIYGNVNGNIIGCVNNIFGNVEGNIFGEVRGDITGYVSGNLFGTVYGSVKLGIRGKKIYGTVIGDGINIVTK